MTNETLASLISGTAEHRHPSCATPETIHAWVTGQLGAPQAEQVHAHVEQCSFCSAEARLAGWFEEPAASPAVDHLAARLAGASRARDVVARGGASVAAAGWWSRRWIAVGLATAATAVLVIGIYSAVPPAVPELAGGQVLRGGTVHVLEPHGEVIEVPEQVVWEGGTADTYRVELLAVDGEVLWSTTANTPAPLPAAAQQQLERGVTYRVRVTPIDDAGEALGQGTESDFRIERVQFE